MNKKGFTLIELLAVFAILAVLLTIVVASVTGIISSSKDNLHKEQTKQIESAARMWFLESDTELLDGESCEISISDIVNKGYIEGNEVIDPKTGEAMTGFVLIKFKNNQYTYTYNEFTTVSSCE